MIRTEGKKRRGAEIENKRERSFIEGNTLLLNNPSFLVQRPPTSDFASGKQSETPSTKKPKLSSLHTSSSSEHSLSYLHVPSVSKKPSPPTSHDSRSPPPVISHMPTLLPSTSGTTTSSQSTSVSRTSSAGEEIPTSITGIS